MTCCETDIEHDAGPELRLASVMTKGAGPVSTSKSVRPEIGPNGRVTAAVASFRRVWIFRILLLILCKTTHKNFAYMPPIPLVLALALLAMSPDSSFAAKLYKWVDKSGVTHFSQTPPSQQEEPAASVERLNVHHGRAVKPRKVGRDLYCGDERLTDFGDHSAVKIANLEQYVINRKTQIESLQVQRAEAVKRAWEYKKSALSDDVRRYDTRLEVEQCKLGWAEAQLVELAGERAKITNRVDTVTKGIEEIERQKVASCGIDTRTGFVKMDDEYRAYQQCVAPFDREIAKLRRELKTVERDQKLIEGY